METFFFLPIREIAARKVGPKTEPPERREEKERERGKAGQWEEEVGQIEEENTNERMRRKRTLGTMYVSWSYCN